MIAGRVLIDGGLANGGRDEPLAVRVEVVPKIESESSGGGGSGGAGSGGAGSGGAGSGGGGGEGAEIDAELTARSVALDEAWFQAGLVTHAPHPWWPVAAVAEKTPRHKRAAREETTART